MNYGEVRDRSLKLVNQYSIAGETIAESYNNQADYLLRIPPLVNDAQSIIASGPRQIRESKELNRCNARDFGAFWEYPLPRDLLEIAPGGLLVLDGEHIFYESEYACPDDKRILVPKGVTGTLQLEYFRRPRPLSVSPTDDEELDNNRMTHQAIPYYVAAHLVLQEDAFAYASLYNEWQSQLSGMYLRPQPHRGVVRNAYGDIYGMGDA